MTTDARLRRLPRSGTARILLGITILFLGIYAMAALSSTWKVPPPEPAPLNAAPAPPVGPLVPEHIGSEDTREVAEVAALRTALSVRTWAQLHLTCDFPDAEQWLSPRECGGIQPPSPEWHSARFREIGPTPFEPLAVSRTADGDVVITACTLRTSPVHDTVTGQSFEYDELVQVIATWVLEPRTRYPADDPDTSAHRAPQYRLAIRHPPAATNEDLGDRCQPKQPLTVQVFENWQHTPEPDPVSRTVAVW